MSLRTRTRWLLVITVALSTLTVVGVFAWGTAWYGGVETGFLLFFAGQGYLELRKERESL